MGRPLADIQMRGELTAPNKKDGKTAKAKAMNSGSGNPFQGIYDFFDRRLHRYEPKWLPISLIYLALAFITGYANYKAGGAPRNEWHQAMFELSPDMGAPSIYRIFPTFLAEAVHVLLGISPRGAYMLTGAIFVFLAMCVFHVFLKKWFSTEITMIGTMFTFAALPLTYGYITQPSDPFNMLIFALGFLVIRDRKDPWLIPIILIGTTNRETTLFLVMAYFFYTMDGKNKLKTTAYTVVYGLCWAAVYVGIHWWVGPRDYYTDFWMYGKNIHEWYYSLAFPALLLGVFWVLSLMDFNKKPKFLRRSAIIIPPFLVLHFLIANMMEVRLFVTLFYILVPMALFSLFKEKNLEHTDPDGRGVNHGSEEE